MLAENKACWGTFSSYNWNLEVNHVWTSYPGYLFLKYILGVQPTSGDFAMFDVRPATCRLTFAEGVVPTLKGLIASRFLSIHEPPPIFPNLRRETVYHRIWETRAACRS